YVAGKRVNRFEVTDSLQTFTHVADEDVTASDVRLQFPSDPTDPGGERGLTVDSISIGGVVFETEAASTFSSGTGEDNGRVRFGYDGGDSLVFDGFFQYEDIVLSDDEFSLPEDSVDVPLAVLVNDRASDYRQIEIASFTQPGNGTLTIVDGVLRYTPETDFVGTDVFTYQVSSNGGIQPFDPANVTITVNESHQQPQSLINPAVASEITPSGKFLEVERLVKLPLDAGGRQPRMSSLATSGDRVFVVTDGRVDNAAEIYELVTDDDGRTTAELFLDVGQAVVQNTGLNLNNSQALFGLHSVAFHPEFETNGKFYTTYTGDRPADPENYRYLSDPENPVAVDSVLAEWTYDAQIGQVDAGSYREIFRVGMIALDHPIRAVVFNPYAEVGDDDYGLLYIGHGDGSVQSAIAGDGQNNDALGKILRIDPLESVDASYAIPASNPFVQDDRFLDEIYAYGFRNPHNLTFARNSDGSVSLIATEIGRDNIEEVNIVVAGGNYGWADREGVFAHLRDQGFINGNIENLPADDALNDYIYPVTILGHDGQPGDSFVGQAIAGGHVIQNGSGDLADQFIFVEFATDGRAYHIDFSEALQQTTTLDPSDPDRDEPGELTWITPQELTILFDHDGDDSTTPLVRASLKDVLDDEPDFERILSAGKVRADLRLGQGPNGELYILNKRNGWVYVATNTLPPDGSIT
ncbi:MAG: PQQ-dependent sugar dehydrogenase, partial [Planctomycetota bacterium]